MVAKAIGVYLLCLVLSSSLYAQDILWDKTIDNSSKESVIKTKLVYQSHTANELAWIYYNVSTRDFKVEAKPFIKFMFNFVKSSALVGLLAKIDRNGTLSKSFIEEIGLKSSFDEYLLDLKIEIPVNLRRPSKLYLSGAKNIPLENDILRPSFFSTYLNIRVAQDFIDNGPSESYHESAFKNNLEWVANIAGVSLEHSMDYNNKRLPDQWIRDKTRLVYDIESTSTRITLGDIDTNVTSFQRPFSGGGVSINKVFNIRPDIYKSSLHSENIILKRPATIEVYQNGKLIHKQHFDAGVVELKDYPFYQGTANIHLKVIDDYGRVSETTISQIYDPRLLAPGHLEYSLNYGYPIDFSTQYRDYDTKFNLFSGFLRYGFAQGLMGGVNAQSNNTQGLFGIESALAHDLGIFTSGAAYSTKYTGSKDNGYAANIEFQNLNVRNKVKTDYTLRLGAEYYSEDFANKINSSTFDFEEAPQNVEWRFNANISQNINSTVRAGFGAQHALFRSIPKHETSISTNFSMTLSRSWHFGLTYRRTLRTEDESFFLTLNWFDPRGRKQFYSNYDTLSKLGLSNFSYQPLSGHHRLQTNVFWNHAETDDGLGANFEYQNQRFILSGSHATSYNNELHFATQSSSIAGGIALAFAGNSFAISRPINEAFAIVALDQHVKNAKIPINRYRDFYQSKIDSMGPAVVSSLSSYNYRHINLDPTELPVGHSLTNEHYIVRPTYKSGINVNVKVSGKIAVMGTVLDENKKPIKYRAGVLHDINTKKTITNFFTNEDGKFFIENVPPGKYYVKLLSAKRYHHILHVGAKSFGIYKVNDLIVKRRSR